MAVDISSSNNDVNELPSRNVTHLPPIKSYLLGPLIGELNQICLFGGCLLIT